ncbi:MAG: hypothetical protein CL940_01570 [Deltaproteobacteria bacterium]|nr:hypothetical protein [Deltaproteobacteria bacterium]
MRAHLNSPLCLLVVGLLWLPLSGCGDSSDSSDAGPVCEAAYPETSSDSAIYVAPSCADDGADGTRDRPFGTIQEAIDSATDGGTIVIEPGSYRENLRIATSGVSLIGSSDGVAVEEAAVELKAPDASSAAVMVVDATETMIQGVHIASPGLAGIWLQRGALTLADSEISSASGDDDGAFGFGLLAQEPAGIWLQRNLITGSASTGVMVHGSSGEITIEGNTIDENARGGIRIENHLNGGAITGNSLTANHETGIALLSIVGIWLQNNGVHDTQEGGPAMTADGIMIAELKDSEGVSFGTSEVVVGGDEADGDGALGNDISGNGRVGLLLSGDVSSVIMNNASDANGRAGIWLQDSAGMKAGIWLQSQAATGIWLQSHHAEAGIWLQENGARGNSFVGVSVGAGSRAAVMSNSISETEPGQMIDPQSIGTISMGDGIGLFSGSEARVEGNSITGNARLGILGDGLSSASVVSGNIFAENGEGSIALQGMTDDEMPSGEDMAGVTSASGAAAYSVTPESNDPNGFSSGTVGMAAPTP